MAIARSEKQSTRIKSRRDPKSKGTGKDASTCTTGTPPKGRHPGGSTQGHPGRDAATGRFRPAIRVTERVDGLELIERGRDDERTGQRAGR